MATVDFRNTVAMKGPNGGWGDQFMRIGYVQNVTIAALSATYSNNGVAFSLTSSAQGGSYLDMNTSAKQGSTPPWVDSQNATGFTYWGSSLTNRSVNLNSYDSPVIDVPSTSPANNSGKAVGDALVGFNISLNFTTYIAAETVDPETKPAYVNLAQFNWQANFNASAVNGSLQIGAGSGFSPAGPGAFSLSPPGSLVPIISGPAANSIVNNETWF